MKTFEEQFLEELEQAIGVGYRIYPSKTVKETFEQMEKLVYAYYGHRPEYNLYEGDMYGVYDPDRGGDIDQYSIGLDKEKHIDNLEHRFLIVIKKGILLGGTFLNLDKTIEDTLLGLEFATSPFSEYFNDSDL